MEASDHSEVSAYGLDLKKNLGIHYFNLKSFSTHFKNNALSKKSFFVSNFRPFLLDFRQTFLIENWKKSFRFTILILVHFV